MAPERPLRLRCIIRALETSTAWRRPALLMGTGVIVVHLLLVSPFWRWSSADHGQSESTPRLRARRLGQFEASDQFEANDKNDSLAMRPDHDKDNCSHGAWDTRNQSCKCFKGWSVAGITDTVGFLQGKCEQYRCQTDVGCAKVLDIPGATCPVRSWNCYCGWSHAFANLAQGYSSPSSIDEPGGKCMGAMYTFAFWASLALEYFSRHAWKVFLPFAIMLLPFGRKRANCDHHRPSLWNALRRMIGSPSQCRGDCVMSETYTFVTLMDDLAWTIYVLDVGLWSYVFAFTFWVVCESIWSIVLWMAVICVIVCSILIGLLSLCGEGLSSCGCDCCAGGSAGGIDCFDCCLFCNMGGGHGGTMGGASDAMYWSGTFPYDPWWGSSGYGAYNYDSGGSNSSCCGNGCLNSLCKPVAWLLYVFPVMPENAWGGLVGYMMGTHGLTPPERLYRGGNPSIEFLNMAWRRRADLHNDSSWRLQVYNFLSPDETAQAFPTSSLGSAGVEPTLYRMQDGVQRQVVTIARAHAVLINDVFSQAEHQCVPSSFEDYERNACWICMGSCEEWDLWLSCKHLFCKNCSTEMLRRRMPCPLCRVASSTVLRGNAIPEDMLRITPSPTPPPTPPVTQFQPLGGTAVSDSIDFAPRVPSPSVPSEASLTIPLLEGGVGLMSDNPVQVEGRRHQPRPPAGLDLEPLPKAQPMRRQPASPVPKQQPGPRALTSPPAQQPMPKVAQPPRQQPVGQQPPPPLSRQLLVGQQPEAPSSSQHLASSSSSPARSFSGEQPAASSPTTRQPDGPASPHGQHCQTLDKMLALLHLKTPHEHGTNMLQEMQDAEKAVSESSECQELLENLTAYARQEFLTHLPDIQQNLAAHGVKELDMIWPGTGYNSVACGGSFEVLALLERSGLLRLGNIMGASGGACSAILALADPEPGSRTLLTNYMVYAKWKAETTDFEVSRQTRLWKRIFERVIEPEDSFARLKQRGWVATWTGGLIPSPEHNVVFHNFGTREQTAAAFFASGEMSISMLKGDYIPDVSDKLGRSSDGGSVTYFPNSRAHLLFYNSVYGLGGAHLDGYLSRCTLESIDILFRNGVNDTIKLLRSADLSVDSDAWHNGGMTIVQPQPGKVLSGDDFERIRKSYPWSVAMSASFYDVEADNKHTHRGLTHINAPINDAQTVTPAPSKASGAEMPAATEETSGGAPLAVERAPDPAAAAFPAPNEREANLQNAGAVKAAVMPPASPWQVAGGRWRYEGRAPIVVVTDSSSSHVTPTSSFSGAWQVAGSRWCYEGKPTAEVAGGTVTIADIASGTVKLASGAWQVAGSRWCYQGQAPAPAVDNTPPRLASSFFSSSAWDVAGGRWQYTGKLGKEMATDFVATSNRWQVIGGRWSHEGQAAIADAVVDGPSCVAASFCSSDAWRVVGGRWHYECKAQAAVKN